MTIKELEERTGMTRANIRFYESEGLLSPARRENGYRDYSEEDVKTLEKIHLLRQLHLDIDTIRLVQKGELPLERALFTLLTKLEGDKTALDKAVEVCRELERAGVEYGTLEPKPWLEQLTQPARPQVTPPPQTIHVLPTIEEMEKKERQAASHPWMRLLAREVDVSIYSLLIHAVLGLGLRVDLLHTGNFADWLISLASLVLMFVAEPLWLHFWGWTPGKWIFGLKLRNRFGEKLSMSQAWSRGWGIFSRGYGFNIPIYNLWRHWKSYRSCRDGEDCDWDYGEERQYTKVDRSLSWLMWLGAEAVSVFLAVTILLQTFLPPNRGALTVEGVQRKFQLLSGHPGGFLQPAERAGAMGGAGRARRSGDRPEHHGIRRPGVYLGGRLCDGGHPVGQRQAGRADRMDLHEPVLLSGGHRRPGWGPAGVQLLQLRPGRLAGALGRAVGQL